jgi:hypothetical protein
MSGSGKGKEDDEREISNVSGFVKSTKGELRAGGREVKSEERSGEVRLLLDEGVKDRRNVGKGEGWEAEAEDAVGGKVLNGE